MLSWFMILPHSILFEQWLPALKATLQYFMMAVTLIVVAVPEGLPMSVTLSLALNMRRMLSTNNLVRKMHACETTMGQLPLSVRTRRVR